MKTLDQELNELNFDDSIQHDIGIDHPNLDEWLDDQDNFVDFIGTNAAEY